MRILCLLGVLAFASSLLANPIAIQYRIQGQITSQNANQPLEYATISAYTTDSTLVDGTITDETGKFQLQLEAGAYWKIRCNCAR